MQGSYLICFLGCFLAAVFAHSAATCGQEEFKFIQNDQIKLGVSLDRGGAIGYLANAKTLKSVINIHDEGRWVGQSYYSGPIPYGKSHEGWANWPWNPVSAGDVYKYKSKVIAFKSDRKNIYVKSIPKQWALENVDGKCFFESWISINKNRVSVRNRLTNHRDDKKQYPAMDQELPFLYTAADYHRLISFTGTEPFTGKPTVEIPRRKAKGDRAQWTNFAATESWAALVNEKNWGVGIIHPGVVRFIGGHYGKRLRGGSEDDSAGYVAAVRKEILDHNIVYEYEYKIVLGSLADIRKTANQLRAKTSGYHSVFAKDRQHWWYVNATDYGTPIRSSIRVKLTDEDPQLIGPESIWQAKDHRTLYLRAAFQTQNSNLEIFWRRAGQTGFPANQNLRFKIIPDGKKRTYEFELGRSELYKGSIVQLRIDPVENGGPQEFVDIDSISFQRPEKKID